MTILLLGGDVDKQRKAKNGSRRFVPGLGWLPNLGLSSSAVSLSHRRSALHAGATFFFSTASHRCNLLVARAACARAGAARAACSRVGCVAESDLRIFAVPS